MPPPSSFVKIDIGKATTKEKRKGVRKKVTWRTTIRTRDKRVLIGQTENVSPNGALISLKSCLKAEDLVFVEIDAFHDNNRLLLQAIGVVKGFTLTNKGYNNNIFFKTPTEITTTFLKAYTAEG
jgi:PilZ domain-containing protein